MCKDFEGLSQTNCYCIALTKLQSKKKKKRGVKVLNIYKRLRGVNVRRAATWFLSSYRRRPEPKLKREKWAVALCVSLWVNECVGSLSHSCQGYVIGNALAFSLARWKVKFWKNTAAGKKKKSSDTSYVKITRNVRARTEERCGGVWTMLWGFCGSCLRHKPTRGERTAILQRGCTMAGLSCNQVSHDLS